MDTDKILQDLNENHESKKKISESDLKTYELLFNSLEKPQEKGFSLGFSNHIIRKIEAKQQRKFNLKIYSLFSVLLLMGLIFLSIFFSKDQMKMLFSIFLEYKFAVIFLLVMVISIQLSNKWFIQKETEN